MSQFVLPEAAGDSLRAVLSDIDGALRYSPAEGIDKEHVTRWRDDLKAVVEAKITPPARGPRKRVTKARPD